MEELKYVIFRLGEQRYGMNLMSVKGIEKDFQIISVPNAPEGVGGIINLRGSVVPVYSLRERFGMEKYNGNSERSLLITKSAGTSLAYEVDEVEEIEEVLPENVKKMPSVAMNEETSFMEQILHIKDDIVIVINVDKVLSEEAIGKVNKLIDANQ